MGISYAPKDSTTPLNARGFTPQMSPTVKDKADSSTKAAIAKGTIVIMDKKNQGQDISTLHRDTENSLNRLKEIFDKSKVEEKQELLGMMEKYGNQAIHAYAESRGWKDGSAEKSSSPWSLWRPYGRHGNRRDSGRRPVRKYP